MTSPVELRVGAGTVHGELTVPADATGVVVFAHGAGSSRHSSRNAAVARSLQDAGLATLLFDMLTEQEEQGEQAGGTLRFDIPLLAGRLQRMMLDIRERPEISGLGYGLFGASTGAAAALTAAAETPDRVRAVVSRGGRPDLAGSALEAVQCPTRLIVGGNDPDVLQLNEQAAQRLGAAHDLRVVPGASHLFEEEGALEQVADFAREWFTTHLNAPPGNTS